MYPFIFKTFVLIGRAEGENGDRTDNIEDDLEVDGGGDEEEFTENWEKVKQHKFKPLLIFLLCHTWIIRAFYEPGPSCSKLMMSLVNVSLKLCSLNMAYMLIQSNLS